MSSAMENFVRVAVVTATQPPAVVRSRRTVQNWQPVTLKFGVGGNITQLSASISEQFTTYQVQRPTEKRSA